MMKVTAMLAALSLCAYSLALTAQETNADGSLQEASPLDSAPQPSWQLNDEQKDQYLRAMQEHSLEMHELSNRILAENDPVKRQALKDQQLQLMKSYRARMMGRLQQMREAKQRGQ